MKYECQQEEVVAGAIRAGEWPAELAAHVAECAICRDVVQTTQWMRSLASSCDARSVSSRTLPDPELAWQRAGLAEQRAKAERVFTVLEWVQTGSAAAAPIGLAGWVGNAVELVRDRGNGRAVFAGCLAAAFVGNLCFGEPGASCSDPGRAGFGLSTPGWRLSSCKRHH